MTGRASLAGQDAFGSQHAVHVIRLGEGTDHNHVLATLAPLLSQVGIEGNHTHRRAGGSIDAFGQSLAMGSGLPLGFHIKLRVEQGIHIGRLNTHDGLFTADQAFIGHVDRDLDGCLGGALTVTGLQHPQPALLDGELDVLHLAIVLLQFVADVHELGICLG